MTTVDTPTDTTLAVLAGLSGLDLPDQVTADSHGLPDRIASAGFGQWLSDAGRVGGCTQPVRLRGEVLTVEAGTGRLLDRFHTDSLPDRVLYKPCGTRRASQCPACAEVYRWDTYQLIRAGLAGGKGIPDTVAAHPALFVTLTAPSFGLVHSRAVDQRGRIKPCRPRRDKPTCTHGWTLSCPYIHHDGDRRIGTPLCLDCYDHNHQVIWNFLVPVLWDRTLTRLRRYLRDLVGDLADRVRIRYAKVAEMQARGAVHLHAILRIDGHDPEQPDAILPPPTYLIGGRELSVIDVGELATLVRAAVRDTGVQAPAHPDSPDGWPIVWGQQLDTTVITTGLPGGDLTERHVAGYLAKYATKSTEATGLVTRRLTADTIGVYSDLRTHVGRLIAACWRLGRHDPALSLSQQDERPYRRLRLWAHMLGFRGHFATKSRRYSTTMGALRAARRPGNRTDPARPHTLPNSNRAVDQADDGEDTTLVIAAWQYAGTGWLTTGDAALAAMAANAARARRPAMSRT